MFPLLRLPDITTGRAGSFKCVLVSSYKTKFGHQHTIFAKGFPLVLWHRRGGSLCLELAGGQWGWAAAEPRLARCGDAGAAG